MNGRRLKAKIPGPLLVRGFISLSEQIQATVVTVERIAGEVGRSISMRASVILAERMVFIMPTRVISAGDGWLFEDGSQMLFGDGSEILYGG